MILGVAITAAVSAVLLANNLYQSYLANAYPKSSLYGIWVEQNVAPYAAEVFVISGAGVAINGGIVDTQYTWDGVYLEHRLGNKTRRFKAITKDFSELKLVSESHYQSTYKRTSQAVENNIGGK